MEHCPFFDSTQEDRIEYVERLDYYFVANKIVDPAKKRAILLNVVGPTTYRLIRTLCLPGKPRDETLKREKCAYLLPSVEYLGHTISEHGHQTAESKVEAIVQAPSPKNVTKLRSFLGLVNYYSKFLSNLAIYHSLSSLHVVAKESEMDLGQ